jgi:hypothetical protein
VADRSIGAALGGSGVLRQRMSGTGCVHAGRPAAVRWTESQRWSPHTRPAVPRSTRGYRPAWRAVLRGRRVRRHPGLYSLPGAAGSTSVMQPGACDGSAS